MISDQGVTTVTGNSALHLRPHRQSVFNLAFSSQLRVCRFTRRLCGVVSMTVGVPPVERQARQFHEEPSRLFFKTTARRRAARLLLIPESLYWASRCFVAEAGRA
jgi:hypothetical protein